MSRFRICCFAIAACALSHCQVSSAQMVTTQMPLQGNSSSFYEHSHIGWGVYSPHYFMSFNGGGGNPPFGGYNPNSGLHTGFAVGNAHFDLGFAQGASLSSTTSAPMLTTTSGLPGFLFIGSERPFVTGVVPQVVGGGGFFSVPTDPLTARMQAGEFRMENRRVVVPADATPRAKLAAQMPQRAELPAPAVRAPESTSSGKDITATQYLERAEAAAKEGRAGVAKIYYQLAATKGDAVTKAIATSKLEAMKPTP